MADNVKDHAMSIGAQLASMEANLAIVMGLVMQAALSGRSGTLDTAIDKVCLLDDQATALHVELRRMQKVMRR